MAVHQNGFSHGRSAYVYSVDLYGATAAPAAPGPKDPQTEKRDGHYHYVPRDERLKQLVALVGLFDKDSSSW